MALDLNDKTSNGNNLTNHAATEWVTDSPFAASTEAVAMVAASSQYLSAVNSASLRITSDITLQCNVKFDSLPGAGSPYTFLSKWTGGSANNFEYFFELFNSGGTNQLHLGISSSGSIEEDISVNWSPSTGIWYEVAVAWTASTKKAQFFVNGVQQGIDQTSTAGAIFSGDEEFRIGARNGGFLDGKITNAKVWNVARSSAQISANYNTLSTGSESGLVGYWPFQTLPTVLAGGAFLLNFA